MKMRNEGRRELDAPIGRRRKWWGGKEKRRMGKREEGVGGGEKDNLVYSHYFLKSEGENHKSDSRNGSSLLLFP